MSRKRQMMTIEVENKEILAALAQATNSLSDMSPLMRSIGQELVKRTGNRFETQTDPAGMSWAPWADSYDPAKGGSRPTDGNTTILDLYHHMLDSLEWQLNGNNSVLVGFSEHTDEPYSAFHEFGTEYMPRRGMLFEDPDTGTLGKDDVDAILELIFKTINGAFDS
jgi:phage virion morphogenesis protein